MNAEAWHLDKRVPIALIVTLVLQTGGMVWWAASLQATVSQQGQAIAALRSGEAARAIEERRISEALARLDERMRAQTEILQRLDRATRP
jgi:hypothetical protein